MKILKLILFVIQLSRCLTYTVTLRRHKSNLILRAGFGKSNNVANSKQNIIKPHSESLCKCGSKNFYGECCEKYHNQTEIPESLVDLVRSRFCAYSIGNMDHIIETTHPTHKEYASIDQPSKRKVWEKSLLTFIRDFEFKSLEFKGNATFIDESTAQIAFIANLRKKTTIIDPVVYPVTLIDEISTFKKDKSGTKWLYSGK